jgi:hypothetical protein
MKAVMLLALVLSTAQAAEPTGTRTLACEGTATDKSAVYKICSRTATCIRKPPWPVSMGIIVNFKARTVTGFKDIDFPLPITTVDELHIQFQHIGAAGQGSVTGSIDRITGGVEVSAHNLVNTDPEGAWFDYSLKCKPTQRMF